MDWAKKVVDDASKVVKSVSNIVNGSWSKK
jgi:hypothetical protein